MPIIRFVNFLNILLSLYGSSVSSRIRSKVKEFARLRFHSDLLRCFRPRDGDGQGDKEIFMYDVTSGSVSRLAGDLSTAFVDAAETNSDGTDSIDDSAFSTY